MYNPTVPGRVLRTSNAGRSRRSHKKMPERPREVIASVFHELGGAGALKEWVEKSEENRRIFYSKMFIRLIPPGSRKDDPEPISKRITIRFV